MSGKSYVSIRDGAIASVIGGVILLLIPAAREYAAGLLSWVWSGLGWLWRVLVAAYSLPGWVWLVISFLALVGLVKIFHALKGDADGSDYKKYVEDFIYGAKWRWSWVGNTISNVWCYCPRCDATLVYDDSSCRSIYSDIKKTDFICENCGHIVVATINGGNKEYSIGAVRREIDRRIRTGDYLKK